MRARQHNSRCLIVGGGPAGLAAALFLSARGIQPRIIDKSDDVSLYSKALGVNPRTLELLEPSGLAQRFLDNGRKMECINLWHKGRVNLSKPTIGRQAPLSVHAHTAPAQI